MPAVILRSRGIALPRTRAVPAALALVVASGLVLRAFNLGNASLWNDELFTRFYVDTGLRYMWTVGFHLETTPPAYYTFMAGWIQLFGTSAEALRWPSVLFSTATIPLVYVLCREWSDRITGLLASLIFACAPMELYYAQEARAYAMMLLPVAAALIGAAWFLRAPTSARAASCYIAGMTFAVYVHGISVFLAASCAIAVAADVSTDRRLTAGNRVRRMALWAAINAVVALMCMPQLLAMLDELHTDQLNWMLPMTFWDVRLAVSSFFAGPATVPLNLASGLTALLLLSAALALLQRRINRHALTVLLLIPGLYFALTVGFGFFQPLLVPRLLCWMWIPFSGLLAILMHGRSPAHSLLKAVVAAVFIVGAMFQLMQNATAKEPWGLLFSRVEPLIAEADLVVTGPWTEPMALAAHGTDIAKLRHWDENFPPTIELSTIHDLLGVQEISRESLIDAIRSGQRVMLIQRSVEYRYRDLLTGVPEPTQSVTLKCWADKDCLSAFYWDGAP